MVAIDSDGQFRAVLDLFDCCAAILDHNGVVVSVNSEWTLNSDQFGGNIGVNANLLDALKSQSGSIPGEDIASGITQILNGSLSNFSLDFVTDASPSARQYRVVVTLLSSNHESVVVAFYDLPRLFTATEALGNEPFVENGGLYRSMILGSSEAYAILGEDRKVHFSNPAFHNMLGYPSGAFEFGVQLDLFHPEDIAAVARNWELTLASPGVPIPVSNRVMNADGVWIWIEGTQTNQLHDPAVRGIVVNTRDVSKQKQLEAELRHMALHDQLTGLPNRTLLADRLDQALRMATESDQTVGILSLDLDNFKHINDKFGHTTGDALIRQAVDRMNPVLQVSETLARVGGDEFVVLLPSIDQDRDASLVADRLQATMATPFRGHDSDIVLGVSIGIATSRDILEHPEVFLRRGEDALYNAKKAGRGRYVLHTDGMTDDIGRRLALESDVRQAAARGEFVLHYQPIIRLATGLIERVEALIRWHHPVYGIVPPNEFIPMAEENGQIVRVGEWVFKEACRQLTVWGDGTLAMAVNFSAAQFREQNLVEIITSELQNSGLDPRQLHVEITEGVLIDDVESIIGNLHKLRKIGVIVTIDDFGTGYSSLRYLRDLPVDGIKIDRSFVSGLESDAGALAIVEGITSLAHAIGLTVTAEGIETAEQLSRLRDIGCDFGQGFYLASPVAAGVKPPEFVHKSE